MKCPLILSGHFGKYRLGGFGTVTDSFGMDQVPGQQLIDAADRVVGDPGKNDAEIEFRIDAVELGRTDERVDGGGAFATGVGTGEQVVLAS